MKFLPGSAPTPKATAKHTKPNKYKSGEVSDFMTQRGKRISDRARTTFSIDEDLLYRAVVEGDQSALQEIGQMGNVGERIATFLPKVKQELSSFMTGTTAYNVALSELYVQAGQQAIEIDTAGNKVADAENRYGHRKTELTKLAVEGFKLEGQRHKEAVNMIGLRALIDYQMSDVDYQTAAIEQTARPLLAQIDADKQHGVKVGQHLLTHGDSSDTSLIPKRQYVTNPVKQAWDTAKSFLGL